MHGPRLSGNGVSLEILGPDATTMILAWRNSKDALLGVYLQPQLTREGHEGWYRRYLENEDEIRWVISCPELGPVGVCGLTDRKALEHTAVLGVLIGNTAARGLGLAFKSLSLMLDYGFEAWGLRRVTVEVFANNPRALGLYEKLGFVAEGRMREGHYDPLSDEHVDVIVMGLLAHHWKEMPKCSR